MAWRLANSLVQLRNQVNAMYPNRSKVSDGTIGDPAHQAEGSASDHNPWLPGEVVSALDLTHDPANGLDIDKFSDVLAASGDPRIKYLIANSRIWQSSTGWQPYSGSNPHDKHIHISVNTNNYDNATNWNIGEDMNKFTKEQIDLLMQIGQNVPATNEQKDFWSTQDATQVMKEILGSEGSRVFRTKAAQFDNVVAALNKEYAEDDDKKLAEIKKIVES